MFNETNVEYLSHQLRVTEDPKARELLALRICRTEGVPLNIMGKISLAQDSSDLTMMDYDDCYHPWCNTCGKRIYSGSMKNGGFCPNGDHKPREGEFKIPENLRWIVEFVPSFAGVV